MKKSAAILIAITATAVASGGLSLAAQQSSATKTASTHPGVKKTTTPAPPPFNRMLLHPALLKSRAPESFKARFTTTKGDFVIEVHREWSPLGADRFYNLVKYGFYNNESFFRVVPGFVVQWGLSPFPPVTAAWQDAYIQDDPVTQSNKRGFVTFATSGPDKRTTQLFINFGDNARLDGMGFSAFGEVIEGMEVVDQLYAGYGEAPSQGDIETQGKTYLAANFPLLDSIKTAKLEGLPVPPQAVKKTVPAKAAPPANK